MLMEERLCHYYPGEPDLVFIPCACIDGLPIYFCVKRENEEVIYEKKYIL